MTRCRKRDANAMEAVSPVQSTTTRQPVDLQVAATEEDAMSPQESAQGHMNLNIARDTTFTDPVIPGGKRVHRTKRFRHEAQVSGHRVEIIFI